MKWWTVSNILIICVLHTHAGKLPSYIHVCRKSNPDINKCIKETVEELRPHLIAGMPEVNVPSIEPMHIEELVATDGYGLKIITKDLKVYGGSNFTIHRINANLEEHNFSFKVSFPHLAIEGLYDVDGKIIMIPIRGSGNMRADVYEVEAEIEMQGELTPKDGEDYFKFTDMKIDISIERGKVSLDNLFGGDKLIGDVVNSAINMNFQYFLRELKPTIEKTLSDFIIGTANKIVSQVPYKEGFPE